jgi:uncharacterized membrane protein
MQTWTAAVSAGSAAFLASLVEVTEAFTIVLAASLIGGWRSSLAGAGLGLVCLVALIAALGPFLALVPLDALRFVVGVFLLLFGLRWLRKAILRAAGLLPLHDEASAFTHEAEELSRARGAEPSRADLLAGATSFKAVMLEGIEVVFIVVAVGSAPGMLPPASVGALLAFLVVTAIGAALRRPLTKIPENAIKFVVGVMLSAFGTFWTTEALDGSWPGEDAFLPVLAILFGVVALGLARLARAGVPSAGALRS